MLDLIGGRKAAAFLVGLIVSVGVYILKGDISDNLSGMIQFLVATYTAGNVGADIAATVQAKVSGGGEGSSAPAAAVQAANDSVAQVQAEVASVKQSIEATMASQEQVVAALGYCQNGISYLVSRMPAPPVQQQQADQSQQSRQPGNPFNF